jgi:hypothetical protein
MRTVRNSVEPPPGLGVPHNVFHTAEVASGALLMTACPLDVADPPGGLPVASWKRREHAR